MSKNLLESFRHAYDGVVFCIKNERNFRIHMFFAASITILTYLYKVQDHQMVLIVFAVMFVFVTEMINTAVEKVVDLHTKNYNKAAKNIKDIAASSVLIAALFSAIVGIAIFNDFEKLIFVIEKIFLNFLNCALFLIYMLINYFFIFKI